jgi:hypothetical protein
MSKEQKKELWKLGIGVVASFVFWMFVFGLQGCDRTDPPAQPEAVNVQRYQDIVDISAGDGTLLIDNFSNIGVIISHNINSGEVRFNAKLWDELTRYQQELILKHLQERQDVNNTQEPKKIKILLVSLPDELRVN